MDVAFDLLTGSSRELGEYFIWIILPHSLPRASKFGLCVGMKAHGIAKCNLPGGKCEDHMGGCQNYGPFLDPYYNTAPNISGTQKGTIILTTTQIPYNPLTHYSSFHFLFHYPPYNPNINLMGTIILTTTHIWRV